MNSPLTWGIASHRQWSLPASVPGRLCGILRRLAAAPAARDRVLIEQDGVAAVLVGMTAIEAFTNILARTVADDPVFADSSNRILKLLGSKADVEKSVDVLGRVFGRPIDKADPRWVGFRELRRLRTAFVRPKWSHDARYFDGPHLQSLVDTRAFAWLNAETPAWVLERVRGFVELAGVARGCSRKDLRGFVQAQLGIPAAASDR